MALKIRSTDYYAKNAELVGKDYFKSHLTKNVDAPRWYLNEGRYTIMQSIKIHIKLKTNWSSDVLELLEVNGFKVNSYSDRDIFAQRDFKETVIMTWKDAKNFSNEVVTHNTYLVHNEMRSIRKKFMAQFYWYEIYENNVQIILDEFLKKSGQRRLA